MSITDKSLKEFILTAKCGEMIGNKEAKDRWHRLGRRIIRVLAEHMGLDRSEYDMWTDKGNDLVPGATVLHSQTIYVKLEISKFSRGIGFVFRKRRGRRDFVGGAAQYMKWESLLDLEDVATRLLQHVKGE